MEDKGGRVIVIGSLNIDLVSTMPTLPNPGETITGTSFNQYFGGKGANLAVAAARVSGPVAGHSILIGAVGDDAFGSSYITELNHSNVDTSRIRIVNGISTGTAGIFVSSTNGENMIVVAPNANSHCSSEWVDNVLHSDAKDIVCGVLEVPIATINSSFLLAKNKHSKTLLLPAPVPKDIQSIQSLPWALTDYLVCNQHELNLLAAATPPITDDSLEYNTMENVVTELPLDFTPLPFYTLKTAGVKTGIVVTLGSEGAIIFDIEAQRFSRVFAPKVVAIDATGAGDAFTGTLAVCLLRGLSLFESVSCATRYAAVTVTRVGAQASYPLASEIPGLFQEVPASFVIEI
jgi:ribokinase